MEALQTSTRITLSNVLLTTDFGKASQKALPYAAAIAREYGGMVFVAHVVSPEPHLAVPLDSLGEDDPLWNVAQEKSSEFLQSEGLRDTPNQMILKRGELWTVLSDLIRNNKIDLLVTGTHGRQGLKRLLLGSEAEKIYRRATCPVLTVGPRVIPLEHANWRPKHILFPTDCSETSLHALPHALSLAEQYEANLILLQLIPLIPWQYQNSEGALAKETLQALVPKEAEAWCTPEVVVDFEFPVEGILHVAEERKVDLIVMGVRRSSMPGISAHLPWPIASEVVSHAMCPVLTIRG